MGVLKDALIDTVETILEETVKTIDEAIGVPNSSSSDKK